MLGYKHSYRNLAGKEKSRIREGEKKIQEGIRKRKSETCVEASPRCLQTNPDIHTAISIVNVFITLKIPTKQRKLIMLSLSAIQD